MESYNAIIATEGRSRALRGNEEGEEGEGYEPLEVRVTFAAWERGYLRSTCAVLMRNGVSHVQVLTGQPSWRDRRGDEDARRDAQPPAEVARDRLGAVGVGFDSVVGWPCAREGY